jgi:hypothetical protein
LGLSPLEQAALGVVVDHRKGPVVDLAGFRRASEAAQQFGTGRVQAVVLQGQAVDDLEAGRGALRFGDGDRSVQLGHGQVG